MWDIDSGGKYNCTLSSTTGLFGSTSSAIASRGWPLLPLAATPNAHARDSVMTMQEPGSKATGDLSVAGTLEVLTGRGCKPRRAALSSTFRVSTTSELAGLVGGGPRGCTPRSVWDLSPHTHPVTPPIRPWGDNGVVSQPLTTTTLNRSEG